MKKISAFLLLMALVFLAYAWPPCAWAEERVYGLGELLRMALERAERIKLAEEDLKIAEAGRERALSALVPKLSLFAEGRKYSEEKAGGTGTLQPSSTASGGVRLDQSISLGGREISGLRAARENRARAGYDLEAVKEGYVFGVASAYYEVLKAKKALGIAASSMGRLKKHRDAAESRLKAGEVTKTALLRAEAELSGAEAQYIGAENRLSVLKAELRRAVAIEGEFDLRESEPDEGVPQLDLARLKEEAGGRRPELKSAARRAKAAMEDLNTAKSAYWPALSLEGVYSRRDDDPSPAFFVSESAYAGLRLSFTVFDGGLRASDLDSAKRRLRQAELGIEDLRRSVSLQVEVAYLDLMTQSGVLKSFSDQLAFARDNYDGVSRQFELGLATGTDVMDANAVLVSAENQYAGALYNKRIAGLGLYRATGALLEKTLGKETN